LVRLNNANRQRANVGRSGSQAIQPAHAPRCSCSRLAVALPFAGASPSSDRGASSHVRASGPVNCEPKRKQGLAARSMLNSFGRSGWRLRG